MRVLGDHALHVSLCMDKALHAPCTFTSEAERGHSVDPCAGLVASVPLGLEQLKRTRLVSIAGHHIPVGAYRRYRDRIISSAKQGKVPGVGPKRGLTTVRTVPPKKFR
jgi:hypothetical protein